MIFTDIPIETNRVSWLLFSRCCWILISFFETKNIIKRMQHTQERCQSGEVRKGRVHTRIYNYPANAVIYRRSQNEQCVGNANEYDSSENVKFDAIKTVPLQKKMDFCFIFFFLFLFTFSFVGCRWDYINFKCDIIIIISGVGIWCCRTSDCCLLPCATCFHSIPCGRQTNQEIETERTCSTAMHRPIENRIHELNGLRSSHCH